MSAVNSVGDITHITNFPTFGENCISNFEQNLKCDSQWHKDGEASPLLTVDSHPSLYSLIIFVIGNKSILIIEQIYLTKCCGSFQSYQSVSPELGFSLCLKYKNVLAALFPQLCDKSSITKEMLNSKRFVFNGGQIVVPTIRPCGVSTYVATKGKLCSRPADSAWSLRILSRTLEQHKWWERMFCCTQNTEQSGWKVW